MPPPNWQRPVYQLDMDNPSNNGYLNEDLIVWMRTAALPSFRKLYRHIDHSVEPFLDGMPAGNYTLKIGYCMFFLLEFAQFRFVIFFQLGAFLPFGASDVFFYFYK